jgi:hypothetical protein
MKQWNNYLFRFLLVFSIFGFVSQNLTSQSCLIAPSSASIGCDPILKTFFEPGPYHIKVYVHVIRNN